MNFEVALQIIGTAGLILGCTWKLSAQISSISMKLDQHIANDTAKFAELESDINVIAPRRVAGLENRRR